MSNFSEARILIVDDNASNVRLLQRILESGGLTNSRSVSDGRQVLSNVKSYKPDVVLLDLHMPDVDGFEVIRQLRSLGNDENFLPVLVLTADINPAARNKALAMGAKDFLSKPFDTIEVLLRVRNLLETRFLYERMAGDLAEYRRENDSPEKEL